MRDPPEKLSLSSLILHIASSSPFQPDQTTDWPDMVPSSGIRAFSSFIKSNVSICLSLLSSSACASDNLVWAANSPWQAWSAFFSRNSRRLFRSERILFCPNESCTLQFSISFTFQKRSLETWKWLNAPHRFRNAWKRICVPHRSLHAWMCLRTRNTERDSTYFALLRKTVVTSTVPCRDCPFLKVSWSGCARCWLRWETWARNLWEGIVRPCDQNITLLTQWQWMDSPSDWRSSEGEVVRLGANARNGVENGEEKGVSIKVPRNMDDMGWLLRKTRLQHNSTILMHVHTTKIACVARV